MGALAIRVSHSPPPAGRPDARGRGTVESVDRRQWAEGAAAAHMPLQTDTTVGTLFLAAGLALGAVLVLARLARRAAGGRG